MNTIENSSTRGSTLVPVVRGSERSVVRTPAHHHRAIGIWHRQQVGIQEEFDRREAIDQVLGALAAGLGLVVLFTVGVVLEAVSDTFSRRS